MSEIPKGYVDFNVVSESDNFIHILIKGLYGLSVQHMQYLLDVHGIKILYQASGYGHYFGFKVFPSSIKLETDPYNFQIDYRKKLPMPPYEITSWTGESFGESNKED